MIRLHEFYLSIVALGMVTALVVCSRTGSDDPGWYPDESQSRLFFSQGAPPVRSMYTGTAPTLEKWGGSSLGPRVLPLSFNPEAGRVRGVLTSLVQDIVVISTGGTGTCLSVTQNGQSNKQCSTFAGPPAQAGQCSVSWTPPPNPTGQQTQACSSTGAAANGGNGNCSSGSGSPNNATSFCSAQGGAAGAGNTAVTCTAANSIGAGAQCSAFQGQNAPQQNQCSVLSPFSNATCSSGSLSVPGGRGGTCSTFQNGNVNSGNPVACSVSANTGNASGSCSTSSNSATEGCSVQSTTNANDFCSVGADANNLNVCTAINGGNRCSVLTGAMGVCSGVVVKNNLCYSH